MSIFFKWRNTGVDFSVRHGQVHRLRNEMLVHWTDEYTALCSIDHSVYRYTYEGGAFQWLFKLPPRLNTWSGRFKNSLARSWFRRYLMPGSGINNLIKTSGGDVVVIFDRVYWYSEKKPDKLAAVIPSDAVPEFAPPLRGGATVHGVSNKIYFGEYLNGHQRDIRVFCVDVSASSVWECWRFSREQIKHIHSIHYDRFRSRLWVCTGDSDHESCLYYTDDEFSSVHKLGGGDQTWRAIAMLFDENGMEWGMDAGKDAPADAVNYIYRYDFNSGQRSSRKTIGNPAYSACEMADGMAVMQTSFEPGRCQETPEAAALWIRDQQGVWSNLLELPYGMTKPRQGVGKYGHIYLPQGKSPKNRLLFTPVNCRYRSYVLYEWRA